MAIQKLLIKVCLEKTIDQSIENPLATKQNVARVDKERAVVKWVAFATFAMVSAIFAKDFLM